MRLHTLDQKGQGAVEYALLLLLVIVAIAAGLATSIGPLQQAYDKAFSAIEAKTDSVLT
jgi:Flp pilus assembly pilin Flp